MIPDSFSVKCRLAVYEKTERPRSPLPQKHMQPFLGIAAETLIIHPSERETYLRFVFETSTGDVIRPDWAG